MQIVIRPTGQVEHIKGGGDVLTGSLQAARSDSRASHIEPVNPLLRVLFRFVRSVTKDDGSIAEWTRTWQVEWRVNIIGGPVLGRFRDRKRAIVEEIRWLESNRL